jgi:hypothetical protein
MVAGAVASDGPFARSVYFHFFRDLFVKVEAHSMRHDIEADHNISRFLAARLRNKFLTFLQRPLTLTARRERGAERVVSPLANRRLTFLPPYRCEFGLKTFDFVGGFAR